jgi:hypothetical protein
MWNSSQLFTEGNITIYVHFGLMISICQVLLESDISLHLLWHFTAVQQQLKSFAMLFYLCFFITDYCDQLSYWHLACQSMAQLLFMGSHAQLRLMLWLFFCFLLAIVQGTKHFPLVAVQRIFSWPPFVIGNITRREDLCTRFWCSSQCNQIVMFVWLKALWLPPGWVWSLGLENYSLQLISLRLPDIVIHMSYMVRKFGAIDTLHSAPGRQQLILWPSTVKAVYIKIEKRAVSVGAVVYQLQLPAIQIKRDGWLSELSTSTWKDADQILRTSTAKPRLKEGSTSHVQVWNDVCWTLNTDDLQVPWDPGSFECVLDISITAWGQAVFQGGKYVRDLMGWLGRPDLSWPKKEATGDATLTNTE